MLQFAQMGFPEMYERALVPPLFRPWAEHIVRATEIGTGDRVLDVACGTGVVARLAKERVGTAGHVVGVDVNPAMIAVARQLAPDIEWCEGDAAALPVEGTGHFDVVVCQQGLQFMPDRPAAIAEMRRALRSAGRLGVSTWHSDEEMPVLRELRRIAEAQVGPIFDRRHSFGEAADLGTLLLDAGFEDVQVQSMSRTIRFDDGVAFVQLNAMALVGMSAAAADLTNETRSQAVAAIVADSRSILEAHTDTSGFTYDIGANVAIARR